MYTIFERLHMAWKWLLSFSRTEWTFEDYPIRVRRNPVPDPSIAWIAQILNWPGPGGLGPTPEAAVDNFRENFAQIVKERRKAGAPMPRPGSHVPIQFASTERVSADAALLDQFIRNVLGFGADEPVFISDESSLRDFGDEQEVERLYGLIRSNFGVDASDVAGARIADILERIATQRTISLRP